VISAAPRQLSAETKIVAAPSATAVTTPFWFTVAMARSEDHHWMRRGRGDGSSTEIHSVLPTGIVAAAGERASVPPVPLTSSDGSVGPSMRDVRSEQARPITSATAADARIVLRMTSSR
jgi:hypothetical protein